MNSFQAAALACRILALYFLFQALAATSQFPLAMIMLSQADAHTAPGSSSASVRQFILFSYFMPFLVSIAFAAFLWIKANWLAKRIIAAEMPSAEMPSVGIATAPDYSSLQRIILTLIGVFMLVTVFPEAIRAMVTVLLTPADMAQSAGEVARVTAENWSLLLRFLLGLTLLFAAPGISNKLDKLPKSH